MAVNVGGGVVFRVDSHDALVMDIQRDDTITVSDKKISVPMSYGVINKERIDYIIEQLEALKKTVTE